MVSRPAGEVSGEIALAEAGGGNGPHPVAPDKLRQEVWGGVGEESFLPTLMHLVLFSHPLARQPQGAPPPHTHLFFQQSPTFLAPGTGFVEDNFSTDWEWGIVLG